MKYVKLNHIKPFIKPSPHQARNVGVRKHFIGKCKDKHKNDGDVDGNTSITLQKVPLKYKAPETPDTAATPKKKAKRAKARKEKSLILIFIN